MAKVKQETKSFSFTIDKLINVAKDEDSEIHSKEKNTKCRVTENVGYLPPAVPTMLPDESELRADEELSECSDTSGRVSGSNNSTCSEDSDLNLSTPPDSSMESLSTPILQRKKKARTAFTQKQIDELEKRYESQRYLSATERGDLADELVLTDQQVKTWFQNRRMKEKRQRHEKHDGPVFPTGGVDVAQLHALGIPCPLPPGSAPQFSATRGMHPSQHLPASPYPMMSILPHPMSGYGAVPTMLPPYSYPYPGHMSLPLTLPVPAYGPTH